MTSSLYLAFSVVLLSICAAWLLRGAGRGWRSRSQRPLLVLVSAWLMVAILTVPSVELALNRLVPGFALGNMLRTAAALLVMHTFVHVLYGMGAASARMYVLGRLAFCGSCMLTLAVVALWLGRASVETQNLIIRALRDGLLLVYVTLYFLPMLVSLWRTEAVAPTRWKYSVYIACFSVVAPIYAGVSVIIGVLTVAGVDRGFVLRIVDLAQPLTFGFFAATTLMLLPNGVYGSVYRLYQHWLRWRLARLSKRIGTLNRQSGKNIGLITVDHEVLETSLYRLFVYIMDSHPLLHRAAVLEARVLYSAINSALSSSRTFETSVQALARISTDPLPMKPTQDNRLALWIGRIFHPYWLCIPTLFAVLSDLPPGEALSWALLCLGLLLPVVMAASWLLERRGFAVYRRETRDPLYIAGGIALVVTLIILIGLNAPRVLIACYAALCLWVVIQGLLNRYVTKVSAHAAVASGCFAGLLSLGHLSHPLLLIAAAVIVLITLWARVAARNHTVTQVILGTIVGAVPVLITFPAILG